MCEISFILKRRRLTTLVPFSPIQKLYKRS